MKILSAKSSWPFAQVNSQRFASTKGRLPPGGSVPKRHFPFGRQYVMGCRHSIGDKRVRKGVQASHGQSYLVGDPNVSICCNENMCGLVTAQTEGEQQRATGWLQEEEKDAVSIKRY